MFKIEITEPATADIQNAFTWWTENRSSEEAEVWYEQMFKAISTLKKMPERCPLVPETGLSIQNVRQLWFGVRNHPTHRVVFVLKDEKVVILRVRHHRQDSLAADDVSV